MRVLVSEDCPVWGDDLPQRSQASPTLAPADLTGLSACHTCLSGMSRHAWHAPSRPRLHLSVPCGHRPVQHAQGLLCFHQIAVLFLERGGCFGRRGAKSAAFVSFETQSLLRCMNHVAGCGWHPRETCRPVEERDEFSPSCSLRGAGLVGVHGSVWPRERARGWDKGGGGGPWPGRCTLCLQKVFLDVLRRRVLGACSCLGQGEGAAAHQAHSAAGGLGDLGMTSVAFPLT